MKTNGLVASAALALLFSLGSSSGRSDDVEVESAVEQASFLQSGFAGDAIDEDTGEAYVDNSWGTWITGAEVGFLRANARTGGQATLTFDASTTAGIDARFVGSNGLQGTGYAPRIWLGHTIGQHFGIVGRFWNFAQNATNPPLPPPGVTNLNNFATFIENDQLQMNAYDLEGMFTFSPGDWTINATAGARHAHLLTRSSIESFGVFTTGNFINILLSNGSRFDGTGVTGSLYASRPIWGSASIYISGRGSALRGLTNSFATVAGSVASSPSAPLVGAATVSRNDAIATCSIWEAQVGLQWERELRFVPAQAFFRTGFEYQYWNVVGLPTGGAGFGGTIGNLTTNTFQSAGLPDVRLLGVSVATGIMY